MQHPIIPPARKLSLGSSINTAHLPLARVSHVRRRDGVQPAPAAVGLSLHRLWAVAPLAAAVATWHQLNVYLLLAVPGRVPRHKLLSYFRVAPQGLLGYGDERYAQAGLVDLWRARAVLFLWMGVGGWWRGSKCVGERTGGVEGDALPTQATLLWLPTRRAATIPSVCNSSRSCSLAVVQLTASSRAIGLGGGVQSRALLLRTVTKAREQFERVYGIRRASVGCTSA